MEEVPRLWRFFGGYIDLFRYWSLRFQHVLLGAGCSWSYQIWFPGLCVCVCVWNLFWRCFTVLFLESEPLEGWSIHWKFSGLNTKILCQILQDPFGSGVSSRCELLSIRRIHVSKLFLVPSCWKNLRGEGVVFSWGGWHFSGPGGRSSVVVVCFLRWIPWVSEKTHGFMVAQI